MELASYTREELENFPKKVLLDIAKARGAQHNGNYDNIVNSILALSSGASGFRATAASRPTTGFSSTTGSRPTTGFRATSPPKSIRAKSPVKSTMMRGQKTQTARASSPTRSVVEEKVRRVIFADPGETNFSNYKPVEISETLYRTILNGPTKEFNRGTSGTEYMFGNFDPTYRAHYGTKASTDTGHFAIFDADKLPKNIDADGLIEAIATSPSVATVRSKYPHVLWYGENGIGDIQGTLAVQGSATGAYADRQSIMVENQ